MNVKILIIAINILMATIASAAHAQTDLGEPSESPKYLIMAGDLLYISVWKEPNLSMEVSVMPDGRISFPLIGEVMAGGQSLSGLRKTIADKMATFVDVPEVSVLLRESRSRRVYTVGKLNNPGVYPMAPRMTVIQAISVSGGFTEWADPKNILIIRREKDKERQLRFNYKQFISGKNPEQNILLNPGDTIIVP